MGKNILASFEFLLKTVSPSVFDNDPYTDLIKNK